MPRDLVLRFQLMYIYNEMQLISIPETLSHRWEKVIFAIMVH